MFLEMKDGASRTANPLRLGLVFIISPFCSFGEFVCWLFNSIFKKKKQTKWLKIKMENFNGLVFDEKYI